MLYWTNAPVAYDGFGTTRTGETYPLDGTTFHQISVPPAALCNDWQRNRYASGLYCWYSDADMVLMQEHRKESK